MFINKTPQLVDDILLSRAIRKNGVNSPSDIIAQHAAQQYRDTSAVRSASQALNLGSQRLAENKRQFDARMTLDQNNLIRQRRDDAISTGLAAVGVGAKIYTNTQEQKRQDELIKEKNQLIEDLKTQGDNTSIFWSRLLKLL